MMKEHFNEGNEFYYYSDEDQLIDEINDSYTEDEVVYEYTAIVNSMSDLYEVANFIEKKLGYMILETCIEDYEIELDYVVKFRKKALRVIKGGKS